MAAGHNETVRRERTDHEHVSVVRIDRPSKRNALDEPTRDALLSTLETAVDEGARALVITGTEGSFASGADLEEMKARTPQEQRAFLSRPRLYESIEAIPRPVIAAINGHALGAGLELAMACDVRVAEEGAKLGSPEVRLGLIPGGGGTQRLPRLVGMGQAMRLVLTGEIIGAEEALELGLIEENAGDAEQAAIELASRMARWSPVALSQAKRSLQAAWKKPLQKGLSREVDAFVDTFASRDAQEGISAFLEDRDPVFEGR